MQNVILHINSFLTTTTTKMLLSIYVYNPPKRISKFENIFLAGILSNTWQAGYQFEPIPHFLLGLGPTLTSLHPGASLSPHHTITTTCIWTWFVKFNSNMPCRGMAWPHRAISLTLHFWTAPPCPLAPSHLPGRARALP
jgi:hypothetical protein